MEQIGWSSIPVCDSRLAVRSLGVCSLAKFQRPQTIDLPELLRLRKKLLLFHIILEPALVTTLITLEKKRITFDLSKEKNLVLFSKEVRKTGFTATNEHYAHSKTALLDLQHPLDQTIQKMPSKARYNIRLSQKKNVEYITTQLGLLTRTQQQEFYVLHDQWSKERKIFGFTNSFLATIFSCFPENGYLIQAYLAGRLVGAMVVLIHNQVGYYYYTCTLSEGMQEHVPTGLLYQALKLSKAEGCDLFDFCSMYDERYPTRTPRWQGFSEFKDRFKPYPIYYPHSFSRWIL